MRSYPWSEPLEKQGEEQRNVVFKMWKSNNIWHTRLGSMKPNPQTFNTHEKSRKSAKSRAFWTEPEKSTDRFCG